MDVLLGVLKNNDLERIIRFNAHAGQYYHVEVIVMTWRLL